MKYYQYIGKIIEIYSNIDGKNKKDIENKFKYICNKIEKCVKNSELEDDFRYFSINWYTLENYYNTIQKEIEENNLSCSYSIDDEDNIEKAFIYVVDYLYEFLFKFKYYEEAYIFRLKFKSYMT